MHCLVYERFDVQKLHGGLFFFDCVREHAFNPNPESPTVSWGFYRPDIAKKFRTAHEGLKSELMQAEVQERVKYRFQEQIATERYDQLNALLVGVGLPSLLLPDAEAIEYDLETRNWDFRIYNSQTAAWIIRQQLGDYVEVVVR